jgi:succinoglycan biosynthesis transport protein ExoP
MDIKDFLRVIKKRRLLLILVPLIAMLIALIFVRLKDGTYVSRVTIATGITEYSLAQDVTRRDTSPAAINMQFANLIGLMNSTLIFDFLSYELLLHDLTADVPFRQMSGFANRRILEGGNRAEIVQQLEQKLRDLDHFDYSREPGLLVRQLLLNLEYDYDSLQKMIQIYRVDNSDYVQIRAESEDPDLSSFMANTLIKYFMLWYERNRSARLDTSIGFYVDQVEARRDVLDRLVRELQNFTTENRISNLYEQAKQISIQLMELELKLADERRNIRAFSSIEDSLARVLGGGSTYYREAAVAGLNNDLARSRRALADYRRQEIRARSNNNMSRAAAYADSIRFEQLRTERILNEINERAFIDPRIARQDLVTRKFQIMNDREVSREAIQIYQQEIARLEDVTTDYARRRAIVESYENDIQTAREEYITLLNKLNEARLASAALRVGAMMELIERAFASEDPMPTKRWLIVIIAGLVAFVFTLLAIFALEYFNTKAQTPMDIANLTGQPVISGIPIFDDNIFDLPKLFTSSSLSFKEQAALDLIRQLRLYLMKHMPGKRLMITSTQASAGKSFLGLFLGFSLARAGKRILLIDFQSRNQTLTQQLGAKPALQQYLSGKVSASEAVTKTDSKFIDVLGCENDIRTPLEITTHENIEERIAYFEQYYDYIIMDATALIRSNIGREIVHHADASLLVMDADTVIGNSDNNAIKFLTRLPDVKFMGIVMNKVQLENLSDFYGDIETEKPVRRSRSGGSTTRTSRTTRTATSTSTSTATPTNTDTNTTS